MTTASTVAVTGHPETPNYESRHTDKKKPATTSSTTPPVVDTYTPSGKAPPADPKPRTDLDALRHSPSEEAKGAKKKIDLTALQQVMKDQLAEQMRQAREALKAAGLDANLVSDILYAVDKDEKAAEVPEEWGADQTSQRIVEFALAFRGSAKDMSDEEFIGTIRKSIQDGFRSAKGDLKDLPGPSAKLFNDTYEAAMKKLDDTLAAWKKEDQEGSASSQKSTAPPSSGFSVVA